MAIRWQDWADVALGAWLIVSPSQLDYWLNRGAAGNAYGIGAALVIFNLISVRRLVDKGQEIFNILLGSWLALSPFAMNFEDERAAAVNSVLVGSAVVILAAWQIHDAIK